MANCELTIHFEEFDSAEGLPEDEQSLVAAAWSARDRAYAPYSHFTVGAAVQTRDGTVYTGSNQENAAFNGSHAERVALDTAGAHGGKHQVAKIAVVGGQESMSFSDACGPPEEPITPCGTCRQDLKEVEGVSGEQIIIILASRSGIRRLVGVASLLPFAFGPASLEIRS